MKQALALNGNIFARVAERIVEHNDQHLQQKRNSNSYGLSPSYLQLN